jgi:signal transduction histidine kinase
MITDLRVSRDELEKMNRELDMKVKERTLQLEKQNLAVKEAQEALLRTTRLASAGEIAGRAAHEVLNPLTSLLTRMGLIEKRVKRDVKENLGLLDEINKAWEEDYKQGGFDLLVQNWKKASSVNASQNLLQEDLENIADVSGKMRNTLQVLVEDSQFIQSEGQRINRIIHGMRKLSNTHSDLKPEKVHSLIDECTKIMGDLFDAEDCRIEKHFHSKCDLVRVDRDEFIQAITNMMRNSLQAIQVVKASGIARANKPLLKIQTRSESDQILIEIEDNGVGIAAEIQHQLFDSNFTTKSKDEGTGIGLGIARRFVRGQGGDIEFVSSDPLKATVFRIRLPVLKPQEVAA